MSSLRRNPLLVVIASLIAVFGITLTQTARTQSVKNQKSKDANDLVKATRNGGLREAAKLKKEYVSSARSSGWIKYDLESLTKNSPAIVIGTPLVSSSKLNESGELVITEHKVRIDQSLKGKLTPGQVVNLRVLGGKVTFEDGTTAEITTPDLGAIKAGTSYIMFLTQRRNSEVDLFELTGGGQGLFEVSSDATIEPLGDKVDVVQKHKRESATQFVEEIKTAVKKYPSATPCCN